MGFVQTGFLLALGALAIPILIHLIFRRRAKRVELGTLRFLKVVLQENARRRKLMRWLLLSLRMACIALLAILFARPFFVARGAGGDERFVALLIDRSASMQLKHEGRRLIDHAIAQAKDVLQKQGENVQVEIAFFDHHVWPVTDAGEGRESPRAKSLSQSLQAPETLTGGTNYGAALAWARDVCVKSGAGRKEVFLFTDLQRSGLDWSNVEPLPRDVTVRLRDLGRDLPNNVAVTAAAASRLMVRPGEGVTVTATVFNAGPFTLDEIPVVLNLKRDRTVLTTRQKIKLEPAAIVEVPFEIAELETGLWRGTAAVEALDDLTFDNQRHIAVMAAPPYRVLVLDGQEGKSPVLSETHFLKAALALAPPGEVYPHSPYDPTVVSFPKGMKLPDLKGVNLIALANVEELSREDAERLAEFVRQGGGVVVFTGENVLAEGYASWDAAGLGVGKIVGPQRSSDLPWRLQTWDEKHPVFRAFGDPQHGDLRRLAFHGYTAVEPGEGVRTLAAFHGQKPAVLEQKLEKGSVLWFLSAADREWSDWPRSRLYLPLVHQMFGYLTGLTEGGAVRELTLDAAAPLDAPAPGVHPRDNHYLVVNVSPRESETDRSSQVDFVSRFELQLDSEEPQSQTPRNVAAAAATRDLREDEIWHWLALALLGVLFVECFVANRTTV